MALIEEKTSRNQEGEKMIHTELCLRVRNMVERKENLQKEKMKLVTDKMGKI